VKEQADQSQSGILFDYMTCVSGILKEDDVLVYIEQEKVRVIVDTIGAEVPSVPQKWPNFLKNLG